MKYRWPIIAALTSTLTLVGGPLATRAATAAGEHDDTLHAILQTTGAATFGPRLCTPDGACVFTAIQPGRFTGDLTGNLAAAVAVTANGAAGNLVGGGITAYSGTVRGCPGPGTVAVITTRIDVVRGVADTSEVLFVPESATGGLAGLHGRGTSTFDPATGTGALSADITCTDPDHTDR